MGKDTKIEWCTHTFNCVWGCMKVSPGCRFCYAESLSKRFDENIWGPNSDRRTFGEKHWNDPVRWNKAAYKAQERRRVFCGSMCDIFEDHPTVNRERDRVFDLVERLLCLDWLLLTKRIERAGPILAARFGNHPPHNLWLGTSVEGQQWADERVPILLKVPAAIRFLSVEPLLGPVILNPDWFSGLNRIDWIIIGGESGPGARPMDPAWAEAIVDTCEENHSRPFVKQLGSVWAKQNGADHPKGGNPAEWPRGLRIREIPTRTTEWQTSFF